MKLVSIVMCPYCGEEFPLKEVVNSRDKDVVNCTCPDDKKDWNERLYLVPETGNIINHKLDVLGSVEITFLDVDIANKEVS